MINNVTLVGRLVAPPDLRKTPNNVSSLQGTLAVNRNFKNENGEREADFINFQAWRGTADIIAQYCSKGSLIGGNSSPFTDPNPFDLPNDGLPF
ncbi:single-strand binding protein family [Streptococcus pneumoniae]|uniref:single-stranded DNA-binding protein n=1 Tax=Streptococcus pneumoniae TaxID=1313 RepID=UPI0005E34756|nr:single-stranded DNA-binding protein [Streptococcus pneumoniae]CEY71244.1 single-strand binding protein family [Streptococcus pneumoniae]